MGLLGSTHKKNDSSAQKQPLGQQKKNRQFHTKNTVTLTHLSVQYIKSVSLTQKAS